MSQKTHPTSLRIASKYKNFYSCWYSDYFYSEMLSYDLEMRSYIDSICDQSKHLQAITRFQNSYKRYFINLFLFDARAIRHSAEKALRLPVNSFRSRSRSDLFLTLNRENNFSQLLNTLKNPQRIKNELQLNAILSPQNGLFQGFDSTQNQTDLISYGNKNNTCFFSEQIVKKEEIKTHSVTKLNPFHSFLEKNLYSTPLSYTTIQPVRILQEVQNAEFLAGEIVYLLQKRAPFRQIQSFILKKIVKNDSIKGIRLSCSGRVGGRSKKAQKSKTQSVQWGETSLHVFSSKLDFANKSASTLFGKVGVKVWLCYK